MRCLAIDIGTTWAKLAVYACEGDCPRLLHSTRIPSGVGEYKGSPESVAGFLRLCGTLDAAVDECVAAHDVDRIGLTSIREGLVLLDARGEPRWVSGNALLDDDRMLDLPINEIEVAAVLPEILALHETAETMVSLQGFFASRLCGRLAITASELSALGLLGRAGDRVPDLPRLLEGVAVAPVGASIGSLRKYPSADVFLAGTDEQASHHGAGIGTSADLGLATATFWSLTAPAAATGARLPEIRTIPEVAPYCATASIIGYRWGPYLQEALSGRVPRLPDRLPRWAIGKLLHTLRHATAIDREVIVDAAVTDIRDALQLLSRSGVVPPEPILAVHGGGLTGLRSFTREVLQRLGHRWVELEGDATQLGCVLAGAPAGVSAAALSQRPPATAAPSTQTLRTTASNRP